MIASVVTNLETGNRFVKSYYLDTEECPEVYSIWDSLNRGTVLDLGYSMDKKKIAVIYPGAVPNEKGTIIGYIPLPYEGDEFLKILSSERLNLSEIIECRIIDKPDQKIRIGLWISPSSSPA